jgi:hypothetical protein
MTPMTLSPTHIMFIQAELKRLGHDPGTVDGIAGAKTKAALDKVVGMPKIWPIERKLTGLIQLQAKAAGIDPGPVDGYWGPSTDHAYAQLRHLRLFGQLPASTRPEDRTIVNPNNWPSHRNTDAEVIAFYGQMGTGLVTIDVPYPHILSWDPKSVANRITCHNKVAPSLLRVLNKVKAHYGMDGIKRLRLDIYGGCYEKRKMRGGNRWSTHSWGIALDYDPANNALEWGRDRASFALPEYEFWWQCWEEEGWVSLGRQQNRDWMHVQAATL